MSQEIPETVPDTAKPDFEAARRAYFDATGQEPIAPVPASVTILAPEMTAPVAAANAAPNAAAQGQTLYTQNADGSFSAAGSVTEPAVVEMPTFNYYVHTADGSVFKSMEPPTGPRFTDESGISHLVIGTYPR